MVNRLRPNSCFFWGCLGKFPEPRKHNHKGCIRMTSADIGLIGLAVMGENLVLNMANNGFSVAVYNRTQERVDNFVNGRGKDLPISGCKSVEEFCSSLARPRKVMLMVRAGDPVDALIEQLTPYLEPGDIIIDGGNSHYPDTARRCDELKEKGILFVGAGISGGEEGRSMVLQLCRVVIKEPGRSLNQFSRKLRPR